MSTLTAKIWTLSGNKTFKNMSITYFANTNVLLLCFGLDDTQSLNDIEFWDNLYEENKVP